jgi:aspartyl-tRNA(Asn)/glutamyl-tRNA(Gln) amidotransferase subunit B
MYERHTLLLRSMAKYVPTIGLEIHAELKTTTKMFCDSPNEMRKAEPNTNICPVCMGHPGTLPVPNKQAIEHVLRVGFALHANVAERAKFDRKNYFYPDLPKGYQISQYDEPFSTGGYIDIKDEDSKGGTKRIDIERVHLEEDTARLVHEKIPPSHKASDGRGSTSSLVDFNRAGVPLMELVTKPVLHSAAEVRAFAQELQLILRYLNASDAELENGLMRVEVNISLASEGAKELGTKVELKNLNSLRVVQDATAYEIQRQTKLLESGKKVVQETRGWDEAKKETFSQRRKEEASDYRYFPEPDIPPFIITKEQGFDRADLEASIPELPQEKRARFMKQYGHHRQAVEVFINDKRLADYFEHVVSEFLNWEKVKDEPKESREKLISLVTNYTVKNLRTLMQEKGVSVRKLKITPENFGEFVHLIHTGEISSHGAREVLEVMMETGGDPSNIIEEKGLKQESGEEALTAIVEGVVKENPQPVEDYKKGKETALKFLVGQVMAKSKGAANPQVAEELLKRKLQ